MTNHVFERSAIYYTGICFKTTLNCRNATITKCKSGTNENCVELSLKSAPEVRAPIPPGQ
jgi:hypothetical protein